MTQISAKELRQNLSDVLKRAMAGEHFEVIYRSRSAVKLGPKDSSVHQYFEGREAGKRLDNLLKDLPNSISPMLRDPNKTYKQLRDEMHRRDPKYRRYLSPKAIDE